MQLFLGYTFSSSNKQTVYKQMRNHITIEVDEDVPLVEFMYLVFTCMPGESYCRCLWSLLLCCDVSWVLIFPLCWGPHSFQFVHFWPTAFIITVQISILLPVGQNTFWKESTHKGVTWRSKDITQKQQRPTIILTWHASKYKVQKFRQKFQEG